MDRGIRGLAALAALVVTAVTGQVVVGQAAQAAPVPCIQTFTQAGSGPIQEFQTRSYPVEVPAEMVVAGATVVDVEVRLRMQIGGGVNSDVVHGSHREALLQAYAAGYRTLDLTFDDEAPFPWTSAEASVGRFRPAGRLSSYDGSAVGGTWNVLVNNPGGQSGPVVVEQVELTLTASDCDTDGDGVLDSVDNCPSVANADQTNWDGDRSGNACDSTPGTPPPPPPTTPPTTTPPTSTPPPTCTVGCAYASTVGLRHKEGRHRFVGTVDSVAVGCRAGVEVTIWRKRSGADRKLVVVTTRPTGTFRTKAPRRAGRYYASVGSPAQPLCGEATSRVVRVTRR